MAAKMLLFGNDGLDQVLVFINEDFTEEDAVVTAEGAIDDPGEPIVITLTLKQQAELEAQIYVNYPYKSE